MSLSGVIVVFQFTLKGQLDPQTQDVIFTIASSISLTLVANFHFLRSFHECLSISIIGFGLSGHLSQLFSRIKPIKLSDILEMLSLYNVKFQIDVLKSNIYRLTVVSPQQMDLEINKRNKNRPAQYNSSLRPCINLITNIEYEFSV